MKKKVLIVDDSETTRINIKNILGEDFTTVEAGNGAIGLERLEEHKDIDLIVLDVNMPEVNGMEFIKIQSEREDINKIPTMMCTTEASKAMKEEAKKSGVVRAWVIKPIVKEFFMKAVKHLLKMT
jgi:CheY-like chemotaxis protein